MPEANFRTRMQHLAYPALAAAVAVLLAGAPAAEAEDTLAEARAAAGRVWYDKYCTQCHGPGGAPGSAVHPGTNENVDLRRYVARHGGKFPAGEWIAVVEQTETRAPHADVWQEILKAQPQTISQRPVARGVVVLIAEYIRSIQTK
jgi:mono/diheme cytochrome c family protein